MIALRLPGAPLWAVVLAVPFAAMLAVLAGFVWFLTIISAAPPPLPDHADGIVVLTGGAERVATALQLLADGRADVLLVSGVNRSADFTELAARAHADPALATRVTLGKTAADTHGNATETAAWVREKNIHSLIVVTAGYHMPRAVEELSRTLPAVDLHPFPILSPLLRGSPDVASLRFLASEYIKFLLVSARLTELPLHPETAETGTVLQPAR